MAAVTKTLIETGYQGAVSVEHEPQSEDPTEAVVRSAITLITRLEPKPGRRFGTSRCVLG